MNRDLAANLELLLTYGPRFLDLPACEHVMRAHVKSYIGNLAWAALEGRYQELWNFHRQAFARAGHPLTATRMVHALA